MPEIEINGVMINFPHENPYTVQRTYMEKVLECLKDSKNGVLESPTGTGKTLSLLCASLAWLQQMKDQAEILQTSTNSEPQKELEASVVDHPNGGTSVKIPKIIYASRTHTQLTQVIQELKGTSYSYMQVGVFASRDQLCIHPELAFESNTTKTEMCKAKTKKQPQVHSQSVQETSQVANTCEYFERYESLQKRETFRVEQFKGKILDVEDLRASGREHKYCPYFMSKTLVDDADIIFMPYNYLLDPKIRHFIGVELTDAVIILDEAHNVPQICEDSASIEFKSTQIAEAVEELKKIAGFVSENQTVHEFQSKTFSPSELNELKEILLRFGRAIDEIPRISSTLHAAEFDGDFIFTIMENADIAYHTSRNIILLIRNVLQYVSDCINLLRSNPDEIRKKNRSKITLTTQSPGLRKFYDILWMTFPTCGDDFCEDIKKHYRVYAATDRASRPVVISSDGPVKTVNYWCFSPKFALQHLVKKQVRSIIFTSGTMSPLQPFISSLGISIDVRLQNGHIIDPSQVLVEIVSCGPDGEQLLSNYNNRRSEIYLDSLGTTVLKFSAVIPNGLLIFFPSYEILRLCKMHWQKKGVWTQIERIKPIFVEPNNKTEFSHTMQNYYNQINNATLNGAIFMAVCRGKVSEGLDFADINGRAVIVTGLPLAPIFNDKVRLKKKYMQKNYVPNESLSGDEWYQLEASRAVNQAIGRVIRHRHDYGAILLCDCRFDKSTQKNQLSQWVQRHIRSDSSRRSFDTITNSISQFFEAQRSIPLPDEVAITSLSVMQDDNQGSPGNYGSPSDEELCTALQNYETSPDGNKQSIVHINNSHQAIVESPITSFTRQIASLPLSSPSSLNTSASSSSTAINRNSDVTPSKQKCTVNLCQRFDEES